MIQVNPLGPEEFEVVVPGATVTVHRVTAREEDVRRLTGGRAGAEALLEESFRFLLERESNTAVLDFFELTDISRYFPEYERVMRERFQA